MKMFKFCYYNQFFDITQNYSVSKIKKILLSKFDRKMNLMLKRLFLSNAFSCYNETMTALISKQNLMGYSEIFNH